MNVHVLGAGSGLPSARRDTTSLLLEAAGEWTLIDCPGAVVHRLARHGVTPRDLTRVVVTHDHVDHVYGYPHLLHAAAIARRRHPIVVHAPAAALATLGRIRGALGLEGEGYPAIDERPIPREAGVVVVEAGGLEIRAAPTAHGRDTRALRVSCDGAALGHSSDTRYHPPLAELFAGVDVLLHDCAGLERDRTGFEENHSSAAEAGRIAAAAGARELRLIHLSPEAERDEAELVREAADAFDGPVAAARDGDLYRLYRRAGGRESVRPLE